MEKTLVIVESPSKATKIQEYLGKEYIVLACKGHIVDLGKGSHHGIGVEINNNFKPHYVLMDDKVSTLSSIMHAAKECKTILLAPDPDREGESIAWHLFERLKDFEKPIKRIEFNEITKDKIKKAIKNPRDIDLNLFKAQEARRILDRIVGFMASPFLINFWGNNLSAGRVQSVVTRMIVDREKEIEKFIPEEYWTIQVSLQKDNNIFTTKFVDKIISQKDADNKKTELLSEKEYIVKDVIAEQELKKPSPPLITSTLQKIMSKEYGFAPDRTMKAAQSLYENGYCSYIRTDSVRANDDAIKEVRDWIKNNSYELPNKINIFKNKDAAQDAHECIRPTDINLLPDNNFAMIDPDEKKVYEIIWKYFIASQMSPAVYNTLKVILNPKNSKLEVKASGKALKSEGFLKLLKASDQSKIDIPNLLKGDIVNLSGTNPVKSEKKLTQSPPRYSIDKLISELENKNIGRPATYADLISKISNRNYVEMKGNVFHPTTNGQKINDILIKYFSFLNYDYTANMESNLDKIAEGKEDQLKMLSEFFTVFSKELKEAYINNNGILCNKCQSPMVKKNKKDGTSFLACSSYPYCRNTK